VVVGVGVCVTAVERGETLSRASGPYAAPFGLLRAAGIGSIAVALGRYDGQISQLVSLYNMNTLVVLVVGQFVLGVGRWSSRADSSWAPPSPSAGGVAACRPGSYPPGREATFDRPAGRQPHRLRWPAVSATQPESGSA
jgi:hypothetical protein